MLRCCAVLTLLLGKRCPNTCFRETLEPTPGALEGVSLHMWCEFDLKAERYNRECQMKACFAAQPVGRVIKCTQQLYCKWRSSAIARSVGKCHVATGTEQIADARTSHRPRIRIRHQGSELTKELKKFGTPTWRRCASCVDGAAGSSPPVLNNRCAGTSLDHS